MKDINKAWLSGVVLSQPSLTTLSTSTPLCIFTLGVREFWHNKRNEPQSRMNEIQIEVLGKNAHKTHTMLKKGDRCEIEGFVRQDKLKNESKTRIRAYSVLLEEPYDTGEGATEDSSTGDPPV